MLSPMSLAINIYKKQRNILLVLVKKIDNMKLWSVLALNGRSLSSEEAEKTATSSHKQDFVLNSKIGLGSAMKKGTPMVYIKYEHVIILLLH